MRLRSTACVVLMTAAAVLHAQTPAPVDVTIHADQVTANVSPLLYGLMTEEINYSYDGGIYGELIRNRSLKEDAKEPVHWQAFSQKGGDSTIELDTANPLNAAVAVSLKLKIGKPGGGVSNDGFWGIPIAPSTQYQASFYAKADESFSGPLTVAILGNDGTVQASAQAPRIGHEWKRYSVTLTTSASVARSASNKLAITGAHAGTVWLNMVSLFPPTYANRANGNRRDIMQLLADMHPALLRFPGGNYLEGNTIETRFQWKQTIGSIAERPGHMDDAWRYWSSDGMGLLEFLNWCEDLHMQPVLALYAGYSLKGVRVKAGADLEPFVEDALDEIEYVSGDAKTTKWGARRAKDGHPAPFPLEYVEIGNEDQFDREPGSYDARFTQFYNAIRAKYPKLKIIATVVTKGTSPDVLDEHYYRRSEDEMASHAHDYDERPRTGPKIFVGEWATRVGEPTPNMSGALGDAAWMTGMERNSDLVIMSAYAPLFVNVNPGGMQWKTDLIGYDAVSSYGSPAYWAQQMFSTHHGDTVVKVNTGEIPTRTWQPPAGRGRAGQPPPPAPAARPVPLLFLNATRDSKTGAIYLKVVNRASTAQPLHVKIAGAKSAAGRGEMLTMAASSPDDTNSITEPTKLRPVASPLSGLGTEFTQNFPPYSISVMTLGGK